MSIEMRGRQTGKNRLLLPFVGAWLIPMAMAYFGLQPGLPVVDQSGGGDLQKDLGAPVSPLLATVGIVPKPTATPTLEVLPTPTAIAVVETSRLTTGGCCSYTAWSHDSEWVLFLDNPSEFEPAGLYGVPVDGGEPTLIHARVGAYSNSKAMVAYYEAGRMYVERWADRTRWSIPSEGRIVRFSPSGRQVGWEITTKSIQFPEVRQRKIWLSRFDGTQSREIVTVNGGVFVGWADDESAILVTGRLAPSTPAGIWRIAIEDGAGKLLREVNRPRSPLLSPKGDWLAYYVAFDSNPENNGLWVMRTDGTGLQKLDLFGAYRWREDGVLLVIPIELNTAGASLWQVDLLHGETIRLTNPETSQIPIANNDWQPSPDGTRIVFLSSVDRNLWVFSLPDRPLHRDIIDR
jgi:hypothetical protein